MKKATPKTTAAGQLAKNNPKIVAMPNVKRVDPLNVNSRLYSQIARLLDELEERDARQNLDIKERIAAMIAIARIQTVFLNLRLKENTGGPGSGSSVRKYADAFRKTNAARGATHNPRPARSAPAELEQPDFGDDDGSDDTAA